MGRRWDVVDRQVAGGDFLRSATGGADNREPGVSGVESGLSVGVGDVKVGGVFGGFGGLVFGRELVFVEAVALEVGA